MSNLAHAPKAPLPPIRAALAPGLPAIDELFDFAADAERRLPTLRLRIEERTVSAAGEAVSRVEALIARPRARVTTRGADGGTEIWVTDGAQVEGHNMATRTVTRRPYRAAPEGLADAGLPAAAAIPPNLGPLPTRSWATTFVRPRSFCTAVLGGATLSAVRADEVLGRTALVFEAAAPRAVGLDGDRADFSYRVAVDRATGMLLAVAEFRGESLVRSAVATDLEIGAAIPDSAFAVERPSDAVAIY
ncbi:MAG: hypothetical protein RLZZ432_938 [Chloroflexota bacterium]